MVFHILINQITTIFLSVNILTTLSFDSEIVSFMYGGEKQDIFIEVTNNMKTLAIKPKAKAIGSNLLVITKNRKYYFNVRYDEKSPHQFVDVNHGYINHAFSKVVENKDYEILEGISSVLFINKTNKPVVVNDVAVESKQYLSKGVPLIRNGIRVYN